MLPRRNPNALPELLIHTSSDEEEENDEAPLPISDYTPAIEETANEIQRNIVYPLVEYHDPVGDVSKIELPAKSKHWCWWCCHTFDTTRFVIPFRYSRLKRLYSVYGNFCSPNCAQAYMWEKHRSCTPLSMTWFRLLCKEVYSIPITTHIYTAPPRERLLEFGGPLTIEEFRANSLTSSTRLIEPPFFVMVQEVHEVIHQEKRKQEENRRRYIEQERIVNADQTPVHPQPAPILPPPAQKRSGNSLLSKYHNKRERKEPVKQQPLKLLRGSKLPGQNSTLARFMKKSR